MEKLLSLTINTQDFETIKTNPGRKSKTYRGLKSQINHNSRKEKMDKNYLVRPENTKLNIHKVVNNLDEKVEKMIQEMNRDYENFYKRKQPKNTKPFLNGLITFSNTMLEDIEKFGKVKLFNTILNFLEIEYGNVISIDLHMDETTPHFHFQVLNYDFKRHKTHSAILEKALRDKNNKYRQNQTQDRLAEYLQTNIKGFDYKRGKISSIKKYHDKRKQQEQHLTEQKNKIDKLENMIQKIQKEHTYLKNENVRLTKENRELENQVENLENQVQEIFKKYENDINELISELTELNEEMEIKDFYRKIIRYLKKENVKKIETLIKKMNRKVKAVKKKKNNYM